MAHTSSPVGALTVLGLHKRFGESVAVEDVSFSIEPGHIFGFVGSNGAGKSTTMRIILGVLAADRGEVTLAGKVVDSEVRRHIGYMPEERGLYPKMQVGEQLTYLARLHGMSTIDARASSEYWTERLGISGRRGDDVGELSLGNQQRVQLAAALVHDPAVLVLDEPFSGLDPIAVDVMSEVLLEKAGAGVPIIFSSHQLDLVQRLCDSVGIIAKGQLVAQGTVDELRRRSGLRLEIQAPDAPFGWADNIPGITTREYGATTILSGAADIDDQLVLKAALSSGPVHHFSTVVPELSEMYREVVAAS